MRISLLSIALLPLALASTAADWGKRAAASKDGVIELASAAEYDDLISADRDYGVTVILTALPASFACRPCHEFNPSFHGVADSWRRKAPSDVRDGHFFAVLDFTNGQQIYQRFGLTSAPNVYYFPPAKGERKVDNPKPIHYDLNQHGLAVTTFHNWAKATTPVAFELYRPIRIAPFIVTPAVLALVVYVAWSGRAILLPIVTSRIVWGLGVTYTCVLFTSGYMWNKIKNAPYVQMGNNGQISWVAQGYSTQLGIETQIVTALYGVLAISVVVLSIFIPAQSSPLKQRLGTLLWIGLLVVVYSMLIRMFKIKNGGYPFGLL